MKTHVSTWTPREKLQALETRIMKQLVVVMLDWPDTVRGLTPNSVRLASPGLEDARPSGCT